MAIDPATRRTLSYITRRLQFERVAVVSTRRAGSDSVTDTGPAVSLDTVTDEVADGILADAGVDSMDVRHELVTACGGVPLVLVETAKLLDAEQRAGLTALPNPLPIGASGHRVVDWRLERLPPSALAALLIAAAEPDGDLVHIMHALATQDLEVAGLELAEDQRLVTLDGDRLSFRHPLIRSAVYHDAPATARRAAHRALADTLPDASPARAWHSALASGGPDEEVARALDDAAAVTNRRGAPAVAGRSWELASRLSPAVEDRVRRLRLAADAVLDAGMAAAAGRLLERADEAIAASPHADDPVERVRRQQLRCRLPPSIGGAANPVATLRAAAREVASASPSLAVDLLLDALAAYIREGALADMADTVEEAAALRDLVDEDRARRIDVIYGALLISRAQPDGERLLDRYLEMSGPARSVDALFLAEVLAPALAFLRRTDAFDALLAELETDLRTRGAVRPLVSVIGAQSMAHYSRSFPASLAAATEAVALAESTGFPELASFAAAVLALCSAVVGDRQSCERAAQLLSDVPEPERRALGPFALGYLAYNQGRYEDADAHFRHVEEISPIGRGLIRWEIEWIETLIRSGRLDDAARVLCALESEVSPRLLRVHGIGRAKGMLATDDATAARHFADDVAIAVRLGNRFYEGRAEHLWGERLRRARRPRRGPRAPWTSGPGPPRRRRHDVRRSCGQRVAGGGRDHRRRRGDPPLAVTTRTASRPPRRRRSIQSRPGRHALPQPTHRRGSPHRHLPQARRQQPPGAGGQSDRRPDPSAVTGLGALRWSGRSLPCRPPLPKIWWEPSPRSTARCCSPTSRPGLLRSQTRSPLIVPT